MQTLEHLDIIFSSDPNYEKLVTEVYFDELFVFQIIINHGLDNMFIVTPDKTMSPKYVKHDIPLEWMLKAIKIAQEETIKRQLLPEEELSWRPAPINPEGN
ncbi:hypothetical protein OQ252_00170 [Acetobacter farinalis]|uniref:Uncharacterized protein n=1 Tax=Acetobacter farinalis TaxID=1260984 RepID=A0ABT3Q3L1_9PROT|nr:hypothetical protein [Acetobacter farinalis]MCX2559816.1 hypothetical protein [Acetobacter farinalis]NHO28477.1 hypothetical protein [Acetobacter farinalis]